MLKIIIMLLAINCVTAAAARFIWGGKLVFKEDKSPIITDRVILIAGMLGQPESAYQYLSFGGGRRTTPLRFSNFGFNPKNAARQLDKIVRPGDTLVGLSIGCKPIIMMNDTYCQRKILINPMTHSIILQAKNQILIEYLAPEAEAVTYLLGWFSIIPFIKTDTGDRYSLALLVDQLLYMYYDDPSSNALKNLENVGVIISTEDEFLANDVMADIYKRATIVEINTMHGRTADPSVSSQYQDAIDFLF